MTSPQHTVKRANNPESTNLDEGLNGYWKTSGKGEKMQGEPTNEDSQAIQQENPAQKATDKKNEVDNMEL